MLEALRSHAATLPSFLENIHATYPTETPSPMPEAAAEKLMLLMRLRSAGIRDNTILNALERVPRDMFINHPFTDRAYEDTALPIECGQTISQPSIVAWMTQALNLQSRHRVLEIGTGSGYQSAVLSHLCRMVYTIERYEPLLQLARSRFEALKLRNINTRSGDGYKGWAESAPFDRIMITAAAPEIPASLVDQLSDQNGVMVLPVGEDISEQWLVRVIKTPEGITEENLMKVRFVPMLPGKAEV